MRTQVKISGADKIAHVLMKIRSIFSRSKESSALWNHPGVKMAPAAGIYRNRRNILLRDSVGVD